MTPEEYLIDLLNGISEIAFTVPVFHSPSRDPTRANDVWAIYAASGETFVDAIDGQALLEREFRVELHCKTYVRLVAVDNAMLSALLLAERVTLDESVFDDWSEGTQPTIRRANVEIPLETTPEGVYRRTRTLRVAK